MAGLDTCKDCGTRFVKDAEYCHKCGASAHSSIGGRETVKGGAKKADTKTELIIKCPACKSKITKSNIPLYCAGCNALFCKKCEHEFRKAREPGEKPFCAKCFPRYQSLIKKLSMGTVVPK